MDCSKLAFWDRLAAELPSLPLPPPPSRVSASDIEFFEAQARQVFESFRKGTLDALMLGVTPGIAAMRWPDPTGLAALDWSSGMIRHQWPRSGLPAFAAPIQADWRRMPLPDSSRDFAVGDCCQVAVDSFEDCAAYHAEVHRVLRPGGRFVQRCILRPERPESLDALFELLFAGKMPNFEVFRRRLAMAMHGSNGEGVSAGDVWRTWDERVPDRDALLERYGWPAQTIQTLERWQGSAMRFPFPTLPEMLDLAGPRLELIECNVPTYEMGERCPRLVLRKR
jgi:SAM-dependent methyltransferase